MKLRASERSKNIQYAIRDVVIPARKLERQGIKISKLNIGDPCAYDFDAPEHMKKAVCEAAYAGYNGYTPSEGYPELLDAIIAREQRKNGVAYTHDDICVTTGVTESLQMLFGASLEPGDEILIPGPTYPPYIAMAQFFGAHPVTYRSIEDEGWQPDVEDIRRKITNRTRAIVLINPNNPTGALYNRKAIKEVCDLVAEDGHIFLISDEIYDEMVFDGEHHASASLASDIPVITFNGMSKIYLVPGWRLGWTMFKAPNGELDEIKDGFMKIARARLCANSICQRAAIAGLNGPQHHVRETIDRLRERRDFCHKRLNEIDGLSAQRPDGAFYIFPKILPLAEKWSNCPWRNDKEFTLDVLNNAHTLMVHGSGFDEVYGKDHFRAVTLPPLPTLETAFDSIEKLMKERFR
ncbi:MAG: alanine aminotransferase [Thermoplasmata archaeon HGW-Thermoplasmata-1]|nr:MAG: alanine aminotransferase [Thermoplasmata archaeon HGW-Thermoplasmata-1]